MYVVSLVAMVSFRLVKPKCNVSSSDLRSTNNFPNAIAFAPSVDHVGPCLQHHASLLTVLGFVVHTTDAAFFVGKALLNPISVEACLVQER